jgi:hypothetical protein
MITRGYVYAATGPLYTTLARRAARNLRHIMPNMEIDLFTDQHVTDPIFAQIHQIRHPTHRPKIEAMQRSRFDRTVLLDADAFPILQINDLFSLLGRYDIAAAHATNCPNWLLQEQPDISRAFPFFNAGVLAFRRCAAIDTFAQEWFRLVVQGGATHDQPAFRRLAWDMRLKIASLPRIYNTIYLPDFDAWPPPFEPPRVLHLTSLHDAGPGDPERPIDYLTHLGNPAAARLRHWLQRLNLMDAAGMRDAL